MKKDNKKLIIGFILGAIIFTSIGVTAATILNSREITYDNTNSKLNATNLQDAIDELYEKVNKTEFKVGDYVSMTPTKTSFTVPQTLTGYTSDQTINPSELNLWRVIRINSDSTVDMVSQDASSVDVYFNGQTGYQNFVGTLNYIAKQYENSTYTVSSRHMGYNGQTEYITDTTALTTTTAPQTSSTSSSNVTSATESKGLGDMGYETDRNLVNAACGSLVASKAGTTTAATYWLASRYYYYDSSTVWFFYGRSINTSGGLYYNNLYRYSSGTFYADYISKAIRPIVTLKSGIKATGTGTSGDPYVLK